MYQPHYLKNDLEYGVYLIIMPCAYIPMLTTAS